MWSKGQLSDSSGRKTRGFWIAALILLVIGLALSGELVRLHTKATTDAAYHSYCAVDATVSCDTVARSAYAIFLGVPWAVWGVLGYLLMLVAAGFGLRGQTKFPEILLGCLVVFSVAVSLALAAVSHFVIHAWCLVCIGTYAVNAALLVPTFLLMRNVGVRAGFQALGSTMKQNFRRVLVGAVTLGLVIVGLILFYPAPPPAPLLLPAPESLPSKNRAAAVEGDTEPAGEIEDDSIPPLKPGIKIETGVTEEGLPWKGAAHPVVTITEFFDYECPHCRQTSHGLNQLLEINPDRLRLVVRHFPLNSDCNRFISRPIYRYSCGNAKLANCAGEQGAFWKAHEYLFEHGTEEVETAAISETLSLNLQALNACMKQDNESLNRDIEAGIALELHGTPVFVVDGQVYMQHLPRSLAKVLRSPPGWH
ncbi:MAG: thioredoxin domain-containing protein [Deltaproteobacteria bacterium]|nr:thioredoxin domain-containing protein [Deltaproteobacteria bacterium]MBN2670253.1 thioredoxin domain-containing protein [Deltaproteobacteria bacterium]